MSKKYPEYKGLNLPNIANLVLEDWESNQIFKKSVDTREGNPHFIFTLTVRIIRDSRYFLSRVINGGVPRR